MDFEHIGLPPLSIGAAPAHSTATPAARRETPSDDSPPFSDNKARRKTAGFVLPRPTATLELAMDDGAPIRVVRHGNPSGPRVVLSHGNGFASDSYSPFWQLMLERFDLALFDGFLADNGITA